MSTPAPATTPVNDAPPPSSPTPPASNNTAPPPSSPTPPASNNTAPPPSNPPPPASNNTAPPPSAPATPATPPPVTASPPPESRATPSPPPATPSAPPPSSPIGSTPPPPLTTSPPPPTVTRSPPPPPHSSRKSPPKGSSPPPPESSSSSSSSSGSEIPTAAVIGISAGCVIILLLLSLVLFCCCKKKRRREEPPHHYPPPHGAIYKDDSYGVWQNNAPPPPVAAMPKPPAPPPQFRNSSSGSGSEAAPLTASSSRGIPKFSYEELAIATNGFSNANLLGQGGFGYVHKGVLSNGTEMAVKQLKSGSGQGEREFQAEIDIIGRVHHRHLVSLIGHCITGPRRLLVYEFVPNNTLEFHLHGKDRPTMDWPTRRRIAIGSAKGLAYLHEDCNPRIIHRDIKAANILLDFQFEAKVADFGLARITSDVNTHVSTRVMGTFGYLAPEYASSGKLTEKSDVFSFGVMLLELITGRRPVDASYSYTDDSLVDWARPLLARALEDGDFNNLVDPRLRNDYEHNEMARMVACAAACVRHSARRRPRMSRILRALEGDMSLADLNEGIQPGQSSVYSSHESSDYDNSQYKEDMRKFRKMALGSQEYGSSEYSGGNTGTSEFGFLPSGSSSEYRQNTQEMEMRRKMNDSKGFGA